MEIIDFDNTFKTLRAVMVIWLLAIFFSAVMFTLALINDLFIVIIISGVTGVLSLIGIFFTGYSLIKLSNSEKYLNYKIYKALNNS